MAASIIDLAHQDSHENSPTVARSATPAEHLPLLRLQRALVHARPERLHKTLLDLCRKCADIAQQASDLLLVAEDEAVSVHESDEESNRSDVGDEGTEQRRPRYGAQQRHRGRNTQGQGFEWEQATPPALCCLLKL